MENTTPRLGEETQEKREDRNKRGEVLAINEHEVTSGLDEQEVNVDLPQYKDSPKDLQTSIGSFFMRSLICNGTRIRVYEERSRHN